MMFDRFWDMIKGRADFILLGILTYLLYISGGFIVREEFLPIAAVFVLIAGLLVLFNQKKTFYLLILLLPFSFFIKLVLRMYMPGLIASIVGVYKDMLIFFLIATITLITFVKKRYSFKFTALYLPMIIFMLFCLAEFLTNSQTLIAGLVGLRRTVIYMFMVLITVSVLRTRNDLVIFLKCFILVGLLLGVGAVAQWVLFPQLMTSGTLAGGGLYGYSFSTGRAASFLQSPNVLGFYLAFVGAYMFGDIFYEKKQGLLTVKALALIFVVAALFLTLSRGAWVAIFCGASLWGLFRFRYLFKKFFFFLMIVGVAFILVINIPIVHFRLMSIFDPDDVSREARMSNVLDKFAISTDDMKVFLFGRGLGTTGAVPEAFESDELKTGFIDLYYLELYTDIGIVGVALFLWIMIRYLKMLYKLEKKAGDPFLKQFLNGATVATLTFLFSGLFTGIGASFEAGMFWTIMGGTLVVRRIMVEEHEAVETRA